MKGVPNALSSELTESELMAGVGEFFHDPDYDTPSEVVRRVFRAIVEERFLHGAASSQELLLARLDRVRSEFERCTQQGLRPPSWADLEQLG